MFRANEVPRWCSEQRPAYSRDHGALHVTEEEFSRLETLIGDKGPGWMPHEEGRYYGSDAKQWYEAYCEVRAEYWKLLGAWEEFEAVAGASGPTALDKARAKLSAAHERARATR